jgi:hypothetical protein
VWTIFTKLLNSFHKHTAVSGCASAPCPTTSSAHFEHLLISSVFSVNNAKHRLFKQMRSIPEFAHSLLGDSTWLELFAPLSLPVFTKD